MASATPPAAEAQPQRVTLMTHLGWPRLLALALCVGFGIALVVANITSWDLEDMDAYWNAAQRLRDGAPLYPSVGDPGAADVFRYSPWFAWLWVPLTHLPKSAVQIGWSGILVASLILALVPALRHRSLASVCLAALLGGFLFKTASTGNVHALLVATLVHSVTRRSGPVWIGVAASLKVVPIVYAFVYAARGEWRRAALSVAVGALLSAPILAYDLVNYPITEAGSFSLLSMGGPMFWLAGAALATAAVLLLGRSHFAWCAASVDALAALPRLQPYDATYLLVGLASGRGDGGSSSPSESPKPS
jgi:hypothetical protein